MRKNEEEYNPAATEALREIANGAVHKMRVTCTIIVHVVRFPNCQLPTSSSKWVGEPDYMYVELKMLPVRRAAEEVINEEGRVGYEV